MSEERKQTQKTQETDQDRATKVIRQTERLGKASEGPAGGPAGAGEGAGPDRDATQGTEAFDDTGWMEDLAEPADLAGGDHPASGKARHRRHRRKHRILRLFAAVCLCALFVAIGHLPVFQIQEIPVIGNKTVTDQEVLDLSGIQQGDSIIFLNSLRAGSRIRKNLYIESVHIKRQLPNTLEIIVKERQAAGQLLHTDKKNRKRYVIIDEAGMVMDLAKEKQPVTTIDDLTVTGASKGSQIRVEEKGSYQKAMDLIAAAKNCDLYFKRIQVKGSLITAWIYDDLKCKGRFHNVLDSMQAGELRSVVYRLYQDDVSRGTINIGDNNYCSFTPKK